MDAWIFLAGLFLFTMVAFIAFAVWSKKRTVERMDNDAAPKSSLAKDGPGPNPIIAQHEAALNESRSNA